MKNFNRDNRQGGGDFNRQMHKAICSNCGKECEVPFKPTGSKPVFCRDCFKNNRGPDSRRFSGRSHFDSGNDDRPRNTEQSPYREQFVALHAKLDKILKILTPVAIPTEITPVVTHLPTIVKEEKIVKTGEEKQPEKQPKIIEKKKKVSKKTAAALVK